MATYSITCPSAIQHGEDFTGSVINSDKPTTSGTYAVQVIDTVFNPRISNTLLKFNNSSLQNYLKK